MTLYIPLLWLSREASEIWTWNKCQRSRIQALEVSYLRGGCGVSRMDATNNESVNGRFGMFSKGEGMSCGVVNVVKLSNIMIGFGHLEGMRERERERERERDDYDDDVTVRT